MNRMGNDTITAPDAPRVYVADLAAYNAGKLRGVWIDLEESTEPDDVYAAISGMLARSPEPYAEEWEIHDAEGLPRSIVQSGLTGILAFVRCSEESDAPDAFAAYVEHVGSHYFATYPDDVLEEFNDAYRGTYDSIADFAAEYAEELGMVRDSDALDRAGIVIDWESTALGWESDWMAYADVPDGVAVWIR